jgi:hypothetical protein
MKPSSTNDIVAHLASVRLDLIGLSGTFPQSFNGSAEFKDIDNALKHLAERISKIESAVGQLEVKSK